MHPRSPLTPTSLLALCPNSGHLPADGRGTNQLGSSLLPPSHPDYTRVRAPSPPTPQSVQVPQPFPSTPREPWPAAQNSHEPGCREQEGGRSVMGEPIRNVNFRWPLWGDKPTAVGSTTLSPRQLKKNLDRTQKKKLTQLNLKTHTPDTACYYP